MINVIFILVMEEYNAGCNVKSKLFRYTHK